MISPCLWPVADALTALSWLPLELPSGNLPGGPGLVPFSLSLLSPARKFRPERFVSLVTWWHADPRHHVTYRRRRHCCISPQDAATLADRLCNARHSIPFRFVSIARRRETRLPLLLIDFEFPPEPFPYPSLCVCVFLSFSFHSNISTFPPHVFSTASDSTSINILIL